MLLSRRFSLTREKMLTFLDELEANSGGAARSCYISPGTSPEETETRLTAALGQGEIPAELAEAAKNSPTGSVFFSSRERGYLILPPFPIRETTTTAGFSVSPLRSLLEHDFRIALVLIRLGAYAIGICHGEKLVTSKAGTGLIHGRHKKGGSSQPRFQRHRGKQIESFLSRVCRHARDHLEPQAPGLDYIVYGGARTTILSLKKQCPFLNQFDPRRLPPLLDIPDPRQKVLETAVSRVWSSRVMEWQPFTTE